MKRVVPVTGEYLIVKKPESTVLRLKNALMYLRIRNSAVLKGLCYDEIPYISNILLTRKKPV
jgi:hypothetical protein